MCFGPGASFAAAAGLAVVAVTAARLAPDARGCALAAVPMIFALHQALEGLVWVSLLGGAQPAAAIPGQVYLAVALVVWPCVMPWAVAFADSAKQGVLVPLAVFGTLTAALLASVLADLQLVPVISGHRITYLSPHGETLGSRAWLILPYTGSVLGPFLLSSRPWLRRTGVAAAVGLAVTVVFFVYATVSVWCFFGAACSALILLELRDRRAIAAVRTSALHA